jgi:hypothetical protein
LALVPLAVKAIIRPVALVETRGLTAQIWQQAQSAQQEVKVVTPEMVGTITLQAAHLLLAQEPPNTLAAMADVVVTAAAAEEVGQVQTALGTQELIAIKAQAAQVDQVVLDQVAQVVLAGVTVQADQQEAQVQSLGVGTDQAAEAAEAAVTALVQVQRVAFMVPAVAEAVRRRIAGLLAVLVVRALLLLHIPQARAVAS